MAHVVGIYMDRSLNQFVRDCEAHIDHENAQLAPNTALIALLCDAIRLTREMTLMANRGLTHPSNALH